VVLIRRNPARSEALSLVMIGVESGSVAWADHLNIRDPIGELWNGEAANP
jgi:hypothetical protein